MRREVSKIYILTAVLDICEIVRDCNRHLLLQVCVVDPRFAFGKAAAIADRTLLRPNVGRACPHGTGLRACAMIAR